MSDSDTDSDKPENRDFIHAILDFLQNIEFKIAILLFIICIFVLSDVFVKHISKFDSAELGVVGTKGSLIQAGTIVGGFLIIDLLTKAEIV